MTGIEFSDIEETLINNLADIIANSTDGPNTKARQALRAIIADKFGDDIAKSIEESGYGYDFGANGSYLEDIRVAVEDARTNVLLNWDGSPIRWERDCGPIRNMYFVNAVAASIINCTSIAYADDRIERGLLAKRHFLKLSNAPADFSAAWFAWESWVQKNLGENE